MTITLQIEAPGLAELQKEADRLGLSVEHLATEIIRRHLRNHTPAPIDAAFRRAVADSVTENEELLRRLAK